MPSEIISREKTTQKKGKGILTSEHIGYSFIIVLVPSLSTAETLKEAFLLCYEAQASGNSPQFILLKPVQVQAQTEVPALTQHFERDTQALHAETPGKYVHF